MTLIPSGELAISSAFPTGAKKIVAPTFLAERIFSLIPPIGPTTPRLSIVPVPATWRPCIKSFSVKSSTSPIENTSPPLGPPVCDTLNFIFFASSASARATP